MTTTVHLYKIKDGPSGEWKIQPLKCSPEGIQKLGGQIVKGTAQTVAKASLDTTGHYRPQLQRQTE